VGGVQGLVLGNVLNDGRVYSVSFLPSDDEGNLRRISLTETEQLIKGFKKKYGVKFKKYPDYTETLYSVTSKGVFYYISVKTNEYLTPSTEFYFTMIHNKLEDIHKAESQAKANDDF